MIELIAAVALLVIVAISLGGVWYEAYRKGGEE